MNLPDYSAAPTEANQRKMHTDFYMTGPFGQTTRFGKVGKGNEMKNLLKKFKNFFKDITKHPRLDRKSVV